MGTILAAAGVATALLAGGSATAQDTREQIYSIRIDGTGLRNLSRGGGNDFSPAVAPDGERIAFTSQSDALGSGVFVVNADGAGLHRVLPRAEAPLWGPRGETLVVQDWDRSTCPPTFATNCAEPFLEAVRSDGTGLRTIARRAQQPAWAPGGERLAYAGESGNSQ